MGLIRATSGTDLMSGDHENIISDYEGTAMLAPLRNLVPDPGFQQWKSEDGTLKYWDLGEPAKPTHWLMFIRDQHVQANYSRQVTGPLSLDKEVYQVTDPLIPGAGPLDADMLIDIAKPLKPKVKAFKVSNNVGFPAGWYCIAYGYDVSKKYRTNNKRMTGPGPRSEPFELAQGNGFYIPAPSDVPEGVNAVVYYLTEPQNANTPEDAQRKALSARMFVQDKFHPNNIRTGIVKFYGPLDRRYKYDGKNGTYIGDTNQMADLTFRTEKSNFGSNITYQRSDIRLGYKIVTEHGRSKSKIMKQTNTIDEFGSTVLMVEPEEFDEEAIGWVPEFYAEDPETAEITKYIVTPGTAPGKRRGKHKAKNQPYFKIGESAPMYGTDPTRWPVESGTSLVEDENLEDYDDFLDNLDEDEGGTFSAPRAGVIVKPQRITHNYTTSRFGAKFPSSAEDGGLSSGGLGGTGTGGDMMSTPTSSSLSSSSLDTTGVEAPTDAPEVPTVVILNNSGLTPGNHWTKTSLFVEEAEGPASEPEKTKVDMGDGLKVHRPKWHDKLTNSDLGDRDLDNVPLDWEFITVTPDYLPEKRGVIQLNDDGASDEDADFFVTPPAELNPDFDRYTVTMKFHYKKHTSGGKEVWLAAYDENDVQLSLQMIDRFSKRQVGKTVQHNYRLSQREDDVASPTLTKIPPEATYVKVRLVGKGSRPRMGPRSQVSRVTDFGAFEGWTVPSTLDIDLETARKTAEEPPPTEDTADVTFNKFTRPHGGYCVVKLDPEDGPIDATFTTRDYTIFETGTNEGWVQNVSDLNTMIGELRQEAALFSKYGVYMASDADGTADTRTNYIKKVFNPDTTMTVSWDMYMETFNDYTTALGAIRDDQNRILAVVSVTGGGAVLLQYNTPGGLSSPVVALDGLDDGMLVHFKLSLNILSGVVTLYFGADEDSVEQVAKIEGISFAQFGNAVQAVLGPSIEGFAVNRFAQFKYMYGKIEVTNLGDWEDIQRQEGNYIEYYGPRGTPRNATYGPTGLRIPCKGFQDYALGVNVWYHDMSFDSELFSFRAMDADHNVLQTYPPLVSGMQEDERHWIRHTTTITTPENTAYLEFHANKLGQGLLRIHGLQVEEGNTPTPFNMDMKRAGWFNVFFSNAQDQVENDDPAAEVGRVVRLRSVMVAGTDTLDVSYLARYRSANTFDELDAAPYHFDYGELNMTNKITEVRVDLSSMVDDQTPEIRHIELDLQRPYSQLLRADGTEYRGGTLAFEVGTPSSPPNIEVTDLASGNKEFDEWGYERPRQIKFKVRAFRRSTAEEISSNWQHTLETDDKRYTIYTADPIEFESQVGSRVYFSDGREYFQIEEASITGYVISEETLR